MKRVKKIFIILLIFFAVSFVIQKITEEPTVALRQRSYPKGSVPKLVFAQYYVWYGRADGPTGTWSHWDNPDNPNSTNRPLDRLYDSRDPSVIKNHAEGAASMGIDVFVISWWGQESLEDESTKHVFEIAERENLPMKYAIQVETTGLTGGGTRGMVNQLEYLLKTYSSRAHYFKIQNRPVIFIYFPASLTKVAEWEKIISARRVAAYDPFYVFDNFETDAARLFDALFVYGPVEPITKDALSKTFEWGTAQARAQKKLFVATVMPGFNNRGIQPGIPTADRKKTETYRYTWNTAFEHDPDWINITSWNEWHEGSEIEPSKEYGSSYLELTREYIKKFKNQ